MISPGIGSRTDDERMIAIEGSRPSRRCGSASRIRRSVLWSVPADRLLPGLFADLRELARRRPAAVDEQPVEPAQGSDGIAHRGGRPVRRGQVGGDHRPSRVGGDRSRGPRMVGRRARRAHPRRQGPGRRPPRARGSRRTRGIGDRSGRDPCAPPCADRVARLAPCPCRPAGDRIRASRAGVTQLAECLLPKQNVAGSNPVSRSKSFLPLDMTASVHGDASHRPPRPTRPASYRGHRLDRARRRVHLGPIHSPRSRCEKGSSSMERDDPAYAGQREYTPLFLKIYDPLILGFFTPVVWRCPTTRLVEGYRRHLGHRHLDVGPGHRLLPRTSRPA